MQNIVDVRNLLKEFGTIIYTSDPVGDCLLMLDELRELKEYKLIDTETFRLAVAILRRELNRHSLD